MCSWRRDVARHFSLAAPKELDLFGSGWNGGNVSWAPWCRTRSPCWQDEVLNESSTQRNTAKRERVGRYRFVIAAENHQGQRGYISEKIFYAMLGGSVPVFLGEDSIQDSVPSACIVDARKYGNIPTLVEKLQIMKQDEWEAMREAGRDFLKSDAFRLFTDEAYAHRMVEILTALTHSGASVHSS